MIDLDAMRLVDTANVYVDGTRAGTLTRRDGSTAFDYVPHYAGLPVATTIPVSDVPVMTHGNFLPPFFAGLLPEGHRLGAVKRLAGTSSDDEFTLLLLVGDDTIGNVQIVPADSAPGWTTDTGPHLDPAATDISFAELFERVVGRGIDLAALPGVQDKISGDMMTLPVTSGRWVLKIEVPEWPELVANEAFFLERAADAGLRTVMWKTISGRDRRPGLLVERFDRYESAGQYHRLAVEDACQVLDLVPGDKYRVDLTDAIRALAQTCRSSIVAAHTFFQAAVFAYLSGNGDLHAKNLSIMRDRSGEWVAAPNYDIPSSLPYGDYTMALPVFGKLRTELSARLLIEVAQTVGVTDRAAVQTMRRLVDAAEGWDELIATRLVMDPSRKRLLLKTSRYRQHKLADQLG